MSGLDDALNNMSFGVGTPSVRHESHTPYSETYAGMRAIYDYADFCKLYTFYVSNDCKPDGKRYVGLRKTPRMSRGRGPESGVSLYESDIKLPKFDKCVVTFSDFMYKENIDYITVRVYMEVDGAVMVWSNYFTVNSESNEVIAMYNEDSIDTVETAVNRVFVDNGGDYYELVESDESVGYVITRRISYPTKGHANEAETFKVYAELQYLLSSGKGTVSFYYDRGMEYEKIYEDQMLMADIYSNIWGIVAEYRKSGNVIKYGVLYSTDYVDNEDVAIVDTYIIKYDTSNGKVEAEHLIDNMPCE